MDRMQEPLTCFKEIVEADLRRGARLIIRIQDEIDPQWRIASPDGDWHIVVQFPDALQERKNLTRIIGNFMVWKQALGFVHVFELATEPQCIMAIGISGKEFHCCVSVVDHAKRPYTKASFSEIEWLPRSVIADADDFDALLPGGVGELTAEDIVELKSWFGPDGREPAFNLEKQQIGA